MNAQTQSSTEMWKLIWKNKSPTSLLLICTDFFEYFKDQGNLTDVSYIVDDDINERIRTYGEYLSNNSLQELNDIKTIKELMTGESAGPDLLIFFCEYLWETDR